MICLGCGPILLGHNDDVSLNKGCALVLDESEADEVVNLTW